MNLQNIPRSEQVVKAAFVPKLDAFVFADYPAIELKLLAMYLESVGHPSMADIFRQGADLHQATADGIGADRQVGKRLNFSIVYGGGMPTLMRQLDVTAKEALDLLRAYHATWPGIGWASKRKQPDPGTLAWAIGRRIDERGYVTTLYGRHLHPHSPHVRLNALCQGTAGDLMKWAMVQTYEGLKPYQSHIVNMVHDELMLDVKADELEHVCRYLPVWMTDQRIEDVVPIKPSCEVSWTTWAEKEEYEQGMGSVVGGGRSTPTILGGAA